MPSIGFHLSQPRYRAIRVTRVARDRGDRLTRGTPAGIEVSKDVWMFDIGLGLVVAGARSKL